MISTYSLQQSREKILSSKNFKTIIIVIFLAGALRFIVWTKFFNRSRTPKRYSVTIIFNFSIKLLSFSNLNLCNVNEEWKSSSISLPRFADAARIFWNGNASFRPTSLNNEALNLIKIDKNIQFQKILLFFFVM